MRPTVLVLFSFWALHALAFDPGAELDRYDVVWGSPSHDAAGSMPIGNGEVGVNLWVEEDGDLLLLISRTDAWSEASRLLKPGRVRVSLTPNPFVRGQPFSQQLHLRDGCIRISAGEPGEKVELTIFVAPNSPVIHIVGQSRKPVEVRATAEIWRTTKKVLQGEELASSWTMQEAPAGIEVWESPDVSAEGLPHAIAWYHHNEHSIVPLTLKHQSLEAFANLVCDPLLNRTFGCYMTGSKFITEGPRLLHSKGLVSDFDLRIAAHSAVQDSAAWLKDATEIAGHANSRKAAKETAAWWNRFWEKSWIFVEGDPNPRLPALIHPLRVGADSGGGSRFSGYLARASVFGRALAEAEVQALASTSPSEALSNRPGLVGTWRPADLKDGRLPNTAKPERPAFSVGHIPILEQDGVSAGCLSDGCLQISNTPALNLQNGFTLEAWIRPASSAGRIFDCITPGGSDGFLFDTYPGRDLRLIVGTDTLSCPNVLTPDRWQHVVAVVDGVSGGRRIYLDGRLLKGVGLMEESPPPSRVTQAAILQRWMAACSGRGHYPCKFNGSIFTVDPEFTGGPKFNPDWRRWGDCYWWQNTRFPPFAALALGDFDQCLPTFNLYRDALPICRARAKSYYGAEGVYFPETMTSFGTYANNDYGWNRQGHGPGDVLCPYWAYAWQQGLELLMLMQDYYEYTEDGKFLSAQLVPMAREVLSYYDTRFPKTTTGKMCIAPAQAVETYWFGVTNDTPSIAGLNSVLERLLALPRTAVPAGERRFWLRLKEATPVLPIRRDHGRSFVPPAEAFDPRRNNCENPELYAIWPFRLFGVGKPDLQTGIETYERRVEKGMNGWSYDGQCAAILGLPDEAARQLVHKVRNSNPAHRFPAMWGPNFDWLPDQDHGSNILLTLQNMLLFADGARLNVLPAWPRSWNVNFKLRAPHRTVVECEFRDGKIVQLKVDPPSRRQQLSETSSK